MPIYEYRCGKCGMVFEHLARNSADKAAKCVKCGAQKPTRQLSTFNARGGEGHDHEHGAEHCDTESCGSCAASGSCPYDD